MNTDQILLVCGFFVTIIVALIGLKRVGDKVQEVHLSINSRFDQFLKLARESGHAEGVRDEAARDKGIDK